MQEVENENEEVDLMNHHVLFVLVQPVACTLLGEHSELSSACLASWMIRY